MTNTPKAIVDHSGLKDANDILLSYFTSGDDACNPMAFLAANSPAFRQNAHQTVISIVQNVCLAENAPAPSALS